jgi:hypothetical protein
MVDLGSASQTKQSNRGECRIVDCLRLWIHPSDGLKYFYVKSISYAPIDFFSLFCYNIPMMNRKGNGMSTKSVSHEDLQNAFKVYLNKHCEAQGSSNYGYAAAYGGMCALMSMVLFDKMPPEKVVSILTKKD